MSSIIKTRRPEKNRGWEAERDRWTNGPGRKDREERDGERERKVTERRGEERDGGKR